MLPAQRAAATFERILPEYSVAVYQGILIQLWRLATTMEGVRLVRKTLARYGDQIQVTMVILENGATRPEKSVRTELDVLGRELAPRFAAVIYEEHGFRAAAVRAVMTSIGLFTRSTLPSRIFATAGEAVEWMRHAYPTVAGLDTIESYLAGLRAASIRSGPWIKQPPP